MNRNVFVEYDQLFIVIQGSKFVIYERKNNEIIPESKVILDNFLISLNKKGYSYFLRYGYLSAVMLFLALALMIILPIAHRPKYLWIPILLFVIGSFSLILYKHLRKKFAEKIKNTYFYHKRKIERFYSIYYTGDFSKSNFGLTPKIKNGLSLSSNHNVEIINQENNFNNTNRNINTENNQNINNRTQNNDEFNYPDINSNSGGGRIPIYNVEKVEEYPDRDSALTKKLL